MKERLIGAAVLAVLAVLLIPLVLDGPDEPLVNDRGAIELPVPSGHVGELRTEVIDLSPRRDAAGSPASSAAASATGADARNAERSSPSADADAGAGDDADRRVSDARSGSTASSDARTGSTGSSDTRAGTASTAARSTAPAAASATPPATATPPAGSAALAEAASSGSTAPSSGSTAPPGASTAASTPARAAAADAPARDAAPARVESNATGDWAVQLGSFGDEDNARRLADRVATFGHSPKISTYRAGGRVMYRVRVGPQATRAAAEAAASALGAHGFPAQVVTN